MDNSNLKEQKNDPKEEKLIPPELIKKEPDSIENIECMEIDETFPTKMEEMEEENITDPIFDKMCNLKTCAECGMHTDCIIQNQINGVIVYFCTDKCMMSNSYKVKRQHLHGQPPTSVQQSTTTTTIKVNDVSSLFVRVCSTCSANIQINDYSNISWQARDFCNEKCLTKHQVRFNSFCIECKCSIIDANNFGKFSMKFGNHIRTFCSKMCLDKYKITLNMCQFCNNDITNDAKHKYLAPVTEHSSTFKQFCSINCVKNYCRYKLKLPYQNDTDNFAKCVVCNTSKNVAVKFQHQHNDIITYPFCSEACFVKFQCFNKTEAVQCYICKVLYEIIYFQRYCLWDKGVKNFCSQNCQTTYYIIARNVVECNNCQVKKYNFDMLQKTFPNNQTIYACSFQCLKNSYKSMSRPIISSCSQNELKRLHSNLKNLMTLAIARNGALANKRNVSTLCHPRQHNASTSTLTLKEEDTETESRKGEASQSGKGAIVPIPFPIPIYVPCPVPIGQTPIPIGIPIPVPVPIFIPTGCRTQEEITSKMNKIWKEMPQDPLQADLIVLAKTKSTKNTETVNKTKIPKPRLQKPNLKKKFIKKDYNFGFKAFRHWIHQTNKQTETTSLDHRIEPLKANILYMTREELHVSLIEFLKEIKGQYPPDTLHTIFLDIQKNLIANGKQEYIFLDISFRKFIEQFNEITFSFHNVYKLNSKLTEDYLWKTNQLGAYTPYTLLNSLIYFNYKLFGLKTVAEHMALLSMQITYSKKPILNLPDAKLKYMYRLKYFPKIMTEETETTKLAEIEKRFYNQKRCPGVLYEFYMSKLPTENNIKSFYLKPELASEADSPIWFTNQVLDEWTMEMMLNRIKMIKEINEM